MKPTILVRVLGGLAGVGLLVFLDLRPTFPEPRFRFLKGATLRAHVVIEDHGFESYVFEIHRPYGDVVKAATAEFTSLGYSYGSGRSRSFYKDDRVVMVETGSVVRVSKESGFAKVDKKEPGTVATFDRYRRSHDRRPGSGPSL